MHAATPRLAGPLGHDATRHAGQPGLTPLRVAHSEWIKLRSVRSTAWTLAVSLLLIAGIGIGASALKRGYLAHHPGHHNDLSSVTLSLFGVDLAQLTIGLLGALLATSEYMTGTIGATLAAVPRRLPVLVAKLAVFAAVILVTCEITLLFTFLASQVILAPAHAGVSLGAPGALRAVSGAGLYLTATGLLGMAVGFAVRRTAGATAIIAGVLLVLPLTLAAALPPDVARQILPHLPSTAGQAIMYLQPAPDTMAPWTGLSLFAGYTTLAIAAAALLLKRRDA